jgi:hypothetical protein
VTDAAAVPTVLLHVWRVRRPLPAFVRMGLDPLQLRRRGGPQFWQLLGTAGDGFGLRDADLHRWALLTCWFGPDAAADPAGSAAAADGLATVRRWDALATERARLVLRPVATRGRWGGRAPFGPDTDAPPPGELTGPVAAITRARVRGGAARSFRGDVPPVARDLVTSPGLRFTMGIGERPTGLLGTFSLWDDDADLRRFAHRSAAHVAVARRSREHEWFGEELFARFSVLSADGTLDGRPASSPAALRDASGSP